MTGILQAILSFFGVQASSSANYIEDVFSTYLYTATGPSSGQTITNNIDLSGKGGMLWIKNRTDAGTYPVIVDTARGANKWIYTSSTAAAATSTSSVTAFNSNGFTLGTDSGSGDNNSVNYAYSSPTNMVSWTFRKQAKFFDVVTYTGNGTNRTISHNLGSVPGTIIIKRTDTTAAWAVYHRSLANTEYLVLNTTAAKATGATYWNSTTPTSTEFSLGTATEVNASGGSATYVAYLFAHDAGGFGAAGTDNVITCGSFTTNASANATVTLNYEPQFVLFKRTDSATNGDWVMFDNMRGLPGTGTGSTAARLIANTTAAENASTGDIKITATGFNVDFVANASFIYIAIRRGPMKTPTSGTSVFTPAFASSSGAYTATAGFPVDAVFYKNKSTVEDNFNRARLLGAVYLVPNSNAVEVSNSNGQFDSNTAFFGPVTGNYSAYINWMFRRAPGFFDVVCYTGTGSARTVTHNLGVAPELMIVKTRSAVNSWLVYAAPLGATKRLFLNDTSAEATSSAFWNNTAPTSSVFTVGTADGTNLNAATIVAYLFATVAGVSKVGNYTGTGTTSVKQVDCGFTGGARFVLIKRTDSTGDWYVWDTARGIVSGNDPYLLLNSTAAEVTTTDWVDTYSLGFELSTASGNNVNINNATYIFLAIA